MNRYCSPRFIVIVFQKKEEEERIRECLVFFSENWRSTLSVASASDPRRLSEVHRWETRFSSFSLSLCLANEMSHLSIDNKTSYLPDWITTVDVEGESNRRTYKYFSLSRTSCNCYWRCSLGFVTNRQQQLISLSPTSHRQRLFVLLNQLSPRPHLNLTSKDVRTVDHLPNFLTILTDALCSH